MLLFNLQKKYASGNLNFTQQSILLDEQVDVVVDDIYSFSEKGFYIGWGISKFGYGQYSMSYTNNKWHINNEGMGINSSAVIIDTLEKGLRSLNDPKLNYMLEKMKYCMSPECSSLAQGLTMIWDNAEKDEGRDRGSSDFVKELILGDLTITNFYTNHDEYVNKKKETIKNIECGFKFDLQYGQFGRASLQKVVNKSLNTEHYTTSSELDNNTLWKIITVVNELEIDALQNAYGKEDLDNIEKIMHEWKNFKNECGLPESTDEMISVIAARLMKTTDKYMKRLIR